jgi:hypothetical protein
LIEVAKKIKIKVKRKQKIRSIIQPYILDENFDLPFRLFFCVGYSSLEISSSLVVSFGNICLQNCESWRWLIKFMNLCADFASTIFVRQKPTQVQYFLKTKEVLEDRNKHR